MTPPSSQQPRPAIEAAIDEWVRQSIGGGSFRNPSSVMATIRRLFERWGMLERHFRTLHHMGHDSGTFVTYCSKLSRGFQDGSGNIYLAKRLACAEGLRAKGFEWEEFLDAIEDHPSMPKICSR
jgi:hypothetical protein